jgi:hypothetical protein
MMARRVLQFAYLGISRQISDLLRNLDEIGGTCRMHAGDEKCIPENLKGRAHFKDLGVGGRII